MQQMGKTCYILRIWVVDILKPRVLNCWGHVPTFNRWFLLATTDFFVIEDVKDIEWKKE